jgi:hypothetical protein
VQQLQIAFEQAAVEIGTRRDYADALEDNYHSVRVPLPVAPAGFPLTCMLAQERRAQRAQPAHPRRPRLHRGAVWAGCDRRRRR